MTLMKASPYPSLRPDASQTPKRDARLATRPAPARESVAVVFSGNRQVALRNLALKPPVEDEVLVDVVWSGVSTGTERLMWSGAMPSFPGMGYPLVPGYEAVGRIVGGPAGSGRFGEWVFVPGSAGFVDAAGLFGASASRLSVPSSRAVRLDLDDPREGVLIALAATAHHALAGGALPDLIVGHGVLGRLLARIAMALGGSAPTVWETQSARRGEAAYPVIDPGTDTGSRRRCIVDASGDGALLDTLISRLAPQGEVVLAGFYTERVSFNFPAAFMTEARLRVAAQWTPADLAAVLDLLRTGRLSLSGLITHERSAGEADAAYAAAFSQPECLKMILNWESFHDRNA